jgi:hypothetical protein
MAAPVTIQSFDHAVLIVDMMIQPNPPLSRSSKTLVLVGVRMSRPYLSTKANGRYGLPECWLFGIFPTTTM